MTTPSTAPRCTCTLCSQYIEIAMPCTVNQLRKLRAAYRKGKLRKMPDEYLTWHEAKHLLRQVERRA